MRCHIPSARTWKRSGFTLIELLTVVAIIGILAAIIIPTVGKVRNTAKKAQCIGLLRQWGSATSLCANDYKSNIALFFRADPFTYAPYLNSAKNMNVTAQDGRVSHRSTIDAMSICPTGINGDNSLNSVKQYAFVVPIGVGQRPANVFGLPNGTNAYFYKASEAAAPAKLLLMVEVSNQTVVRPDTLAGIQAAVASGDSIRKMQINEGYVRHGGIAHGLFLDGHIGALTRADTDYALSKDLLDRYFSLK
jgi:prepilin-type N-terminal cleavage/methylation domain-containing protein